jgi:hypothetical protein
MLTPMGGGLQGSLVAVESVENPSEEESDRTREAVSEKVINFI